MKRLNVFQVLMIAFFCVVMISCNKNDELNQKEGRGNPNNYYSVVKMKQDYTLYAMGIENKNKNYLRSVTPMGQKDRFLQLKNGYWVTKYGLTLDGREVVTDISIEEFEDLYDKYAETNLDKLRDTLYSRIIDRDPFEELYFIPKKDFSIIVNYVDGEHYGIGGPDIDKINEMIESGEFFTYEGVERVK